MNKHEAPITLASLHTSTRHDSGPKHVTGTAEYIDDMIEPAGTMHAYLALSTRAHPHGSVSVPLSWQELAAEAASDGYTVRNVIQRLHGLKSDPWREYWKCRQQLPLLPR